MKCEHSICQILSLSFLCQTNLPLRLQHQANQNSGMLHLKSNTKKSIEQYWYCLFTENSELINSSMIFWAILFNKYPRPKYYNWFPFLPAWQWSNQYDVFQQNEQHRVKRQKCPKKAYQYWENILNPFSQLQNHFKIKQ